VNTESDPERLVRSCAEFIEANGGEETVALDLRGISGFTDYFIITTARSDARLRGLVRKVREYLDSADIHPAHSAKRDDDSGWLLYDCGFFVIHLMLEDKRQFYDLERLWYGARCVYVSPSVPVSDSTVPSPSTESGSTHSSESSG
jgi:ribosome-associated protein